MKLARRAYKAAPVVIPIGLAAAKYAMDKLGNQKAGKQETQPARRNVAATSQDPAQSLRDRNERG